MQATLNDLELRELLLLPGSSSWSGSFSGMDEFYNGDESRLIFANAGGGNSESDSRNIILTCHFGDNDVISRIRNISDSIDKQKLINSLNLLSDKQLSQIFTTPLEYSEISLKDRIKQKTKELNQANNLTEGSPIY